MPKVTYRQIDGREDTIDVPLGWSLMEAAVQNDIAGIVAECGGGCACATCHVYIDGDNTSVLPEIGDMEGEAQRLYIEPLCPAHCASPSRFQGTTHMRIILR